MLTSHVSENASEPGGNNLLEAHVWWDIDDELKRSHISSFLPLPNSHLIYRIR